MAALFVGKVSRLEFSIHATSGLHIKLILTGESAIRIKPDTIFLPKPSALREIYWDPKCNEKSSVYGHGGFGPPNLFTTRSSADHKPLRKALGAAPVSH
jgi:hypothetical protein